MACFMRTVSSDTDWVIALFSNITWALRLELPTSLFVVDKSHTIKCVIPLSVNFIHPFNAKTL
jgi:hypothetical protein